MTFEGIETIFTVAANNQILMEGQTDARAVVKKARLLAELLDAPKLGYAIAFKGRVETTSTGGGIEFMDFVEVELSPASPLMFVDGDEGTESLKAIEGVWRIVINGESSFSK
jgi:hypothetical protein